MVEITKKIIQKYVDDYIDKGYSPSDQPQPRDRKYFAINGIVQELYEWFKIIPERITEGNIEIQIRKILRLSERIANTYKTHKVNEVFVANVCKEFLEI